LLAASGYYPDSANGLLGRKTRDALKKFQKEYGLPETGRSDAPTLDALRALGGK
jgi:peptidoglycan hydrolase-like protein with peptidoglycan-binding domain